VSGFDQGRFLIQVASWLAPRRLRRDWRREWEAETRHAWRVFLEQPISRREARARLREWCWGAFADAACLRFDRAELRESFRQWQRKPSFCLAALGAVLLAITLASGFLPATRATLLPLPYANRNRIATVSLSAGSLAMRSAIPSSLARLWRLHTEKLDGVATYAWKQSVLVAPDGRSSALLNAEVDEAFFDLFGVRAAIGRTFAPGDLRACVLSDELWRRRFERDAAVVGQPIDLDGGKCRIVGVLPKEFWFLSREIAVWSLGVPEKHTGVVVRFQPGAGQKEVDKELQFLAQQAGYKSWDSMVDVSVLQERVRSTLGSFLLALGLALITTLLRARMAWPSLRGALFFGAKTALLLIGVLLAGLEFTHAASITMIGGTDLLAEPISTWLFLIGSMGALTWSVYDQRLRCRTCTQRLALPAHVGCSGCLLLSWAGTEMVCMAGHGMLHVPEMPSSWTAPEQWTPLDESWQELFAKIA
jgi:hypothetical protein